MAISGYMSRLPPPPEPAQLAAVIKALKEAKKPVVYLGGGTLDAAPEVREFVKRTGIPVASTLMGLGTYPATDPLALQMLGMHGTVFANYSVDQADLMLALGVRFDDRVTGKLEAFATHARIVHIDVDPAEIHKNKHAHIPICADVRPALQLLNKMLEADPVDPKNYADWRKELDDVRSKFPMRYPDRDDVIAPQHAVEVLYEESKGEAIITTGVGQHQMFAAQWYPLCEPRRWVTSGGLGSMGFGLPSALGAAAAHDGKRGRPKRVVVDIDGDGSFLMNCQELATAAIEKLNCKVLLLNNQHLGMVVHWEDRFYKANRAHTYLGKREAEWHETQDEKDIYPDFITMAKSFGVPAKRVIKKTELRAAMREMLDTEGPFLLEVMVPHIEHVLPMIPGGATFKDIITEGDGSVEY
jgi:acetolactate synthase-1/2/3 large subunit